MVTVDMTKVELEPKSLLIMAAAFTAVLVIYGFAQFGATWTRNVLKGASRGIADKAEEAF